jgi:hypothetical protein
VTPNGNGNGGIKIPGWLSGIVVTTLLGLIIGLWQTNDARAERTERRLAANEQDVAVLKVELKHLLTVATEAREVSKEVRALLISLIENPVPRSRTGR